MEKSPNILKSEHLIEPFRPIIACVLSAGERSEEINLIKKNGENLDWHSIGMKQHLISTISPNLKFTEGLYGCTSLIACGVSQADMLNVSFITHQASSHYLIKDEFESDLLDFLNKLKDLTIDGSVDIVIAGGDTRFYYKESIDLLSETVNNVFGFNPVVIVGPKDWDSDSLYFDTQNRRLFVVRKTGENGKAFNQSFTTDKIPKEIVDHLD